MIRVWFISLVLLTPSLLQAQFAEYYIGRDSLQILPTGPYAGLPNPNFNRITFLYAHTYTDNPSSNHYHSKGTYSYTGPNLGNDTAVNPFNPSNFLPEGARPPLKLGEGSGVFAGKHISGLTPGVAFSNLEMRSVDSLSSAAPGSPENILFVSSNNRWSGLMTDTNLHLRVISLSNGLSIADSAGNTILAAAGDTFDLGSGSSLNFTPIFVADPNIAPIGTNLSARLSVFDSGTGNNGNPWLDGGEFVFNFQVASVPEPGSIALCSLALVTGGIVAWRQRKSRQK
ncbi:MAG TPA: all3515 family Zur-repressed PEP-CTERM protein [Gemmatales bacterium]|nr:all3515 family Zur-repressed PEP-CTERM protein [Gemmatales bacterium]